MGGAFDWEFHPPASPAIGDHDVPLLSRHLEGRRIALLLGAGIAAMKAPLLARALRQFHPEAAPFSEGDVAGMLAAAFNGAQQAFEAVQRTRRTGERKASALPFVRPD